MPNPILDTASEFDRQHKRLSRITLATLGLLLVLFCAVAATLVHDSALETRMRGQAHATYGFRNALRSFTSRFHAAEASQRGYLLTGDRGYLQEVVTVSAQEPAILADLRGQARALGLDISQLNTLHALSRSRLDDMGRVINLREAGDEAGALKLVRTNHGRTLTQRIGALSEAIDAAATRGATKQSAVAEGASLRSQLWGAGLAALFVAALALGGLLIDQAFRHRDRLFRQLQETAARQAAVLDSATDTIITLNPSGTIESINPAGERLFGYAGETVDRWDIRRLLDLELPGEGPFLSRLGLHTGAVSLESEGKAADGRRFPADVAFGAMELESGVHVVAIVRDITERRRSEEVKNQFVSAVSHELRTPLTSITGSLGLLNGGAVAGIPEGAKRLISLAHSNSERLGRLVDDILDIEKIQSGRMRLLHEPFDLRAVFRKTVEDLEGYVRQFGVHVQMRGDEAPVWAMGDAERIAQVAANLISNAAKFSPEGGQVRVGFAARDGVVQVSVSDDGPGIPEDFRARVFSRFAQADNSDSRQRGGTGLGLAICKEIVERLGGSIFFATETGKGARFFVNLPAATASAGETPAPAKTPVMAVQRPLGAPRILICEDDMEMCEFLSAIVAAEGGEVELAHSLAQAETALAANRYSAMFLDMKLPDGEGLTLLEAIKPRAGQPVLPVVVVSADEARRPRRVGAGAKLVDWVEKPLRPARLRKALRDALAIAHAAAAQARPLILHVEDDPDVAQVVSGLLAEVGEVVAVPSLAAAKHAFATRRPDLIVLDMALTDGSGGALLPFTHRRNGERIPVIVFSGQEPPENLGEVDLVLPKGHASLGRLAFEAHRLLQGAPAAEAA